MKPNIRMAYVAAVIAFLCAVCSLGTYAQNVRVPVYFAHKNIPIRALSVGLQQPEGMTTSPRGSVPCKVSSDTRTCFGMVFVEMFTDAPVAGVKFVLRTKSDGDRTRTSNAGGLVQWEVTRGEQMWGEITAIPAGYSQTYKGVGINFTLEKGFQCCAGFVQWEIVKQ